MVFFAFHEYSRRRFSIFLKIDFSFTILKKEAELTEEYSDLKRGGPQILARVATVWKKNKEYEHRQTEKQLVG